MIVCNELLGYPKYKIYQDTDLFHFSIDSMLLGNFVTINKKTNNIIDLCSGNFPIPMFLTLRTDAKIKGVEILDKQVELAKMSINENKLDNQIEIIHSDVKELVNKLELHSFDVVTCNPPFYKVDENSNINPNYELAIARHELLLNLEDIINTASKLLKDGGYFAMVHTPSRLAEIFVLLDKYGFSPDKLQLVMPKKGKDCNHVLIEARKNKNKNPNLKILEPLYIYKDNNEWTEDVLKIYNYGMKNE